MKKAIPFVLVTILLFFLHYLGVNFYAQSLAENATSQVSTDDSFYILNKSSDSIILAFDAVLILIWLFVGYKIFVVARD